jgi:hypothetical protein
MPWYGILGVALAAWVCGSVALALAVGRVFESRSTGAGGRRREFKSLTDSAKSR